MSRRRYVLAAALLAAFLVLLLLVAAHTAVDRFDQDVWRATKRHEIGWLVTACRVLTDILSPPVDVLALLLGGLRLTLRDRVAGPVRAALMTAVVLGVLVIGCKLALGRPNPGSLRSRQVDGAFPSGHAASLVGCGAALILLFGMQRVRRAWLLLGALSVLVGAALVYAHYHFVTDVLGGLLLASAMVLVLAPQLTGAAPATSRRPRPARPSARDAG